MAKDFLYCEETDTKIFPNDVVSISTYPDTKWVAKQGWYFIGTARKYGWYFVSIADKTIISIDIVDIANITKDTDRNHKTTTRKSTDSVVPTVKDAEPIADYLHCEATDTLIYPNDIVELSGTQYVAKCGWYKLDDEQHRGWYFLSVEDRIVIPISDIDLDKVTKPITSGTSEYRPTLQDIDTSVPELNYIVIPDTNVRLYDSDIVKISNKPRVKWVVHSGWYIYQGVQNFGWYFVSINDGETLPLSVVDLTLVSLATTKTQGSNKYDGKVVNYTRPFTEYDAEILRRTFITVDTIQQRDNLDKKQLTNGRLVRVNDVDGIVAYYSWNSTTKLWDKADLGGGSSGIPEIIGDELHPIILSDTQEGLYRVIGYYKVSPADDTMKHTEIDHIAFISGEDAKHIEVITDCDITDYVVEDDEVTFKDKFATEGYVDNAIKALEDKLSEIISELVSEALEELIEPISDDYIRSLFV